MCESSKMCRCQLCGSTVLTAASSHVSWKTVRWSDEAKEGQVPTKYVMIGNIPGIKTVSAWTSDDRRDFSCFLIRMPEDTSPLALLRGIEKGIIDSNESDFVRFWHQLDDTHKERRLLLSYFCLIRDADERSVIKVFNLEDDPLGAERIHEALREWMSEIAWIIRRIFIGEQQKPGTGGFSGTVNRFYAAHVDVDEEAERKCANQFFGREIRRACYRITEMEPDKVYGARRAQMISAKVGEAIAPIFRGFVALQAIWEDKDEQDRQRFLNELRSSEVHWRQEDRGALMRAIESNGTSCPGTYVHKLITAVGMDQFKLIAFGKERFCDTCHRSSHVGNERLWACKQCVDEHVRPKPRYCSVQCQRADWMKHKALFHEKGQK